MQSVFTLLAVAGLAPGQTNPDAALEQARARLQAMAHHLEKYVCIETVNRNYYRHVVPRDAPVRSETAPACSQTAPATTPGTERRELESTDRVRLEVTVSQGARVTFLARRHWLRHPRRGRTHSQRPGIHWLVRFRSHQRFRQAGSHIPVPGGKVVGGSHRTRIQLPRPRGG